jgi:hypothetical protein
MKNTNSPGRIHWSTIEANLVRQKVLEMVSNRKMPRSSWADIFEVAQRELPMSRRRHNTSLNPNAWLSEKTGLYCTNTTQLIAVSVLRELGHDVRKDVRVSLYSHYLALQSEKNLKADKEPEVAIMAVVSHEEGPAERIASKLSDARQKMISHILEHEKDVVLSVAKEQLNPMEQRLKDDMNARMTELSKTMEYLGQQIGLITEFITSHGYNPKK